MTDIDIVIVNYKSAAHTFNCIESVHRAARHDGVAVQVFVVNNGDDALADTLKSAGPATVIENAANVGFGAAANIGARRGSAPVVLFLNPDAAVGEGCLERCLAFLRDPANAGIGIVGPELRDPAGNLVRSCSRLPTIFDLMFRSAGLHVLLGRLTGYPYLPAARHQRSGIVGQAMGAALAVRRPLFDQLNGFDEAFFLYYEDVDFCARAHAVGAACYYLKEAHAVHIGRASSSQDSGMALALHVRSRLTYARRHFGFLAQAALAAVCALVEFPLRLLQAAAAGRAAGTLRAYRLLARNLLFGDALPRTGE